MSIISVEVLDAWEGNVVPGDPSEGDIIRITYESGTIREKIYRDPVPVKQRVYVHVDVSGPMSGGIVAIRSNNTAIATITFTLREGKDPTSAVLDTISKVWDVALRDGNNDICDHIAMSYENGVATVPYTSNKAGMVRIHPRDVNDTIGNAIVTLVSRPEFLVYRNFI